MPSGARAGLVRFSLVTHFALPHLTLPYLTSPYLTFPHLTSPYLTSPYSSRERHDALALACGTGQLETAQLLAGYGAIPRRRIAPGAGRGVPKRPHSAPATAAVTAAATAATTAAATAAAHAHAAPAAPAAGSADVARWLSACKLWCRPLHYVDGALVSRVVE